MIVIKEYIPPCKRKRTFFDLFVFYDCNDCKLLVSDEYYNIGNLNVNIYYIERCLLNVSNDEIIASDKLKILLKDSIINQSNNIIIWLDKFDFDRNEQLIYDLLSFDLDVQIIC